MLTSRNFTREEAITVMAIISGSIAADLNIDQRELNYINNLICVFDITEQEKERFKSLHVEDAAPIISKMSQKKKHLVACLLTSGILADGRVHPLEERYLQFVHSKCGLPIETDINVALKVSGDFFVASL